MADTLKKFGLDSDAEIGSKEATDFLLKMKPATAPTTLAPVVGSSAPIRDALAERGVTKPDSFNLPSVKSFEEFTRQIQPGTPPPAGGIVPSLDVFQSIRQSQGITALEDEDVGLEAEKEDILAAVREERAKSSAGVSQKTFIGRMSETERNAQERIDVIERRQRIVQMKVKNKNAFISDYMKFSRQDFEDARHDYEFEFNKNLQMQTAYQRYKDDEERKENQVRDDARATMNTMNNLIQNSGKNYAEYVAGNPGFASKMNELELMAGIPVGSFEAFAQSKPKANLLATVEGKTEGGEKTVSFIYADADGTPGIVETTTLTGVTAGGAGDFTETQIQQGAEAAGVTEAEFRKFDPVKQRDFIFGRGKELHGGRMDPTKFEAIKQNFERQLDAGSLTRGQVEAQIDTLPSAKDRLELLLYLDEVAPPLVGLFEGFADLFK